MSEKLDKIVEELPNVKAVVEVLGNDTELEYEEMTGDNADNGMVVIGYEFPEKEISEAPETGNNKFKVIVKGEIFLTLLPNQLNSLRFVRSEKR